ncbi:MAG: NADH-quinone oxidoreductase subunit G [Betaproteobacteria bacterium RIFCSPLOWO2_12_FULL_64_23]|nr:MAG: NADH-quinone oxidoreductase subunit G [Betaproteobacteria bacterium RIFCSPLOWO2_12_FULL_64_23]
MPKVEIDGRQIEVHNGATVMDAANALGIAIPHFCYHKKLSIAANCRMCLVQVEKAPKPMPACATPVTDGMKVFTESEYARTAQKGVMEFLLINHPLDCPICDQGGECQLQDLAVGYGNSASRYREEKRVVFHKNVGPLISMEEMSRCIHCTRCVRFGQEIAGVMELGMMGRGEHAEIVSFVGRSVDSELSGNMIDLCPVGALTSKPFRYSARTWELARRKSVSPHDSLGSNLMVQVMANKVMRVLPLENEELNECWLSDRDRFSYEGLNCADRLTQPMLKVDGQWQEVDWPQALAAAAKGLKDVQAQHGAQALGALAAPHSTLEELHLLGKLMRGSGSENVDFRLRQSDFSADRKQLGAPWLGMNIADINGLDRVLVVGSFLRKDHPLVANRLRQAAKRGQQVNLIHASDDDLLLDLANKAIVPPQELPELLAQVVKAVAEAKQQPAPAALAGVKIGAEAKNIAASLASGARTGIFLGNLAAQHPQATQLRLLAQELAGLLGASFGFFGEAANSVGGYLAQAVPGAGGLDAAAMLAEPRKAYLLLNAEPELDCNDPHTAMKAMHAAEFVICLSAYKGLAPAYASVLLPIAPFTETSGSFVNAEGRMQSFNGVVKPLGEARPAWKVLRVLGNLLGLAGFDYDSSEQVREELGKPGEFAGKLDNRLAGIALQTPSASGGLQRIADVPIYAGDAIVRRAASLQQTRDAGEPRAWMNAALLARLGLKDGQAVKVRQGEGEAAMNAALDERLPRDCVRLAAAHAATSDLGPMSGEVRVEPQ